MNAPGDRTELVGLAHEMGYGGTVGDITGHAMGVVAHLDQCRDLGGQHRVIEIGEHDGAAWANSAGASGSHTSRSGNYGHPVCCHELET